MNIRKCIDIVFSWYCNNLSHRTRQSLNYALNWLALFSSIATIIGSSFKDFIDISSWMRLCILALFFLLLWLFIYVVIGSRYRDSINMLVRNTPVTIRKGDIFKASTLNVIGCDTHFDSRIDDIVISKNSLHGQLFLKHGDEREINKIVKQEAERRKLEQQDGLYTFELGTIIPYYNSSEDCTYLMLAMTELDDEYKAKTNLAKFETMLMKMWHEIDRVYAGRNVALPLLGSGISRFEDGPRGKEDLLRCMLCTLNTSGVTLDAQVEIILKDDSTIDLYEYKNIFQFLKRR